MSDTDETVRELLLSIAAKLRYERCDIKLTPIGTNGANFSSKLYEATISASGKPDIELFGKVGIIGKEARAVIKVEIYTREFVFYNEVINMYKYLEDKHDIRDPFKLCVAKFYGCSREYLKETIVLENLRKKGFMCYDRFKSVNWAYASASVKQLAILHALSIAFAQEYPQKFAGIAKKLEFVYPKRFFEKVADNAIYAAKDNYRERLSIFLSENLKDETFEKFFKPGKIEVIIHGDFRPSNLMHRVLENDEMEVAVLDFQTIQTGNPVMDLLYYITNGSDEGFRREHYHQLINHYYGELCSAMRRFHLDPEMIYPKESFEYDYKQVLPYGLLIAIFTLPFVTVDPENVPSIDGNFERDCLGLKTSALFAERLNGLISDYVKMGVL